MNTLVIQPTENTKLASVTTTTQITTTTAVVTKVEARQFNMSIRSKVYLESKGRCNSCKKFITWDDYECDHIIPYSLGGMTRRSNAQALCRHCNRAKSDS